MASDWLHGNLQAPLDTVSICELEGSPRESILQETQAEADLLVPWDDRFAVMNNILYGEHAIPNAGPAPYPHLSGLYATGASLEPYPGITTDTGDDSDRRVYQQAKLTVQYGVFTPATPGGGGNNGTYTESVAMQATMVSLPYEKYQWGTGPGRNIAKAPWLEAPAIYSEGEEVSWWELSSGVYYNWTKDTSGASNAEWDADEEAKWTKSALPAIPPRFLGSYEYAAGMEIYEYDNDAGTGELYIWTRDSPGTSGTDWDATEREDWTKGITLPDNLIPGEAPAKIIFGADLVISWTGLTSVPYDIVTYSGKVSSDGFTSPLFNFTFNAGTLLFNEPVIDSTLVTSGERSVNITQRYTWNQYGWQKILRASTLGFDQIVSKKSGEVVQLYETADLRNTLPW